MRRVHAAVWILVFMAGLAFFSHITVRRITNTLEIHLGEIHTAAQMRNYPAAKRETRQMLDYLAHKQHWLELFVKREAVASIAVNLHGLSAYANEECINDLLSEVNKASQQIEMLEHLFFSVF